MDEISLNSIAKPQYSICLDCFKKFPLLIKTFEIRGHKAMSLYEYDEFMKGLIYQFKGCFDFELKDVFLEHFLDELRLKYRNYVIVPVPSHKDHDEIRGFNHVEEIFKTLSLPMIKCISKIDKVKQSDRTSVERKNIGESLVLDSTVSLEGKNVLIVDDIHTTGSTLNACFELIEKLKPNKIKALVLCKTRDL